MSATTENPLRRLPSVNELVESPALAGLAAEVPRSLIVEAARQAVDAARQSMLRQPTNDAPTTDDLVASITAHLKSAQRPALSSVINATGIIIHTGLGRSPMAESAVDALADVALHYAPVELDMATGERGKRADIVRSLLCEVTGAESATVVNNCAAALLITLATFAKGKEVIVSRGELIEIGGSFRLPEVMAASGAILREVGTTNKTRAGDYADAIGDHTGAILKVHPSNYVISGFTKEASIADLAESTRTDIAMIGRLGDPLPVIHDIGSGALVDVSRYGLHAEPVARASIEAGADLVLFSGDKLLGGPQAGIIVGRRELIERIEANQLMRALRVDKLTLAALGATLQLHRDPQRAAREVPILAMLTATVESLRTRAERIASDLADCDGIDTDIIETTTYLGGGSVPTQGFASVAVQVRPNRTSETELMHRLRTSEPRIVARVQGGAVLFEVRTIFPQQDAAVAKAIRAAIA